MSERVCVRTCVCILYTIYIVCSHPSPPPTTQDLQRKHTSLIDHLEGLEEEKERLADQLQASLRNQEESQQSNMDLSNQLVLLQSTLSQQKVIRTHHTPYMHTPHTVHVHTTHRTCTHHTPYMYAHTTHRTCTHHTPNMYTPHTVHVHTTHRTCTHHTLYMYTHTTHCTCTHHTPHPVCTWMFAYLHCSHTANVLSDVYRLK